MPRTGPHFEGATCRPPGLFGRFGSSGLKVAGNARMVRPVLFAGAAYERLPEVGKDMEDPLVNLAAIVGWLVLIISSIPVALLVFTKRPKGDRPR